MAHLNITESDRLQLIGLLSVGSQLLQQLNTVDQAMCRLLDVKPDHSGYSGHISDTLYEADTHSPVHLATTLLHQLHIEVVLDAPLVPAAPEQKEPLPVITRPLPVGFSRPPSTPREEPPF